MHQICGLWINIPIYRENKWGSVEIDLVKITSNSYQSQDLNSGLCITSKPEFFFPFLLSFSKDNYY